MGYKGSRKPLPVAGGLGLQHFRGWPPHIASPFEKGK